jgi:hypothetical protein
MPLNLKPILTSLTDNEKLDAINYNFDQIVANGGGPLGAQGAIGAQGLDGLTGAQGIQGTTGSQGRQGPQGQDAENYWKINVDAGTDNNTLVPIHDSSDKPNPPTVMFGVDSTDPLYDSVIDTSAVVFNKKSGVFQNNLELTDDDVTNIDGNKIYFKLGKEGTNTVYEMGFGNTSSGDPTAWKWFSDSFQFTDGTNNFANLNSGGLELNVPSQFNKPSNFSGLIKYTYGSPGNGKVLVSSDTVGTAEWKSVSEIGGVVPIGTIVPILTSVFTNSVNFDDGVEDATPDSGTVLKINYGRGKAGSTYEGWYLCNGKTWTNGVGSSTQVPNLSSFTYGIAEDGSGTSDQLLASQTTANNAIIGGVAIDFQADYSSSTYTTSYTPPDNTTETFVSASTGTQYDLTKLVYVIYLGEDDLYWQDAGSGSTITHYYLLVSRKSESDSSSGNYTITVGSTYTLTALEGSTQVFTITLTPSAGYSFTNTTNVALYEFEENGSIFGQSTDSTVTQTGASINGSGQLVLTLTDSDFSNIGGTTSYLIFVGNSVAATTYNSINVKRSNSGFSGNTSSAWADTQVFIPGSSSTLANTNTLYANSSGTSDAGAGWYAQTLSGAWTYRYWTGNSFSGPTLTGVGTAPGSWTPLNGGTFSNYKVGSAPYGASNNICNSTVSVSNKANGVWATTSESVIDAMTTSSATVWVVGTNSGIGYSPVNFTSDSTYGVGYFRKTGTDGLCYKAWNYNFNNGVITRQTFSCASVSPSTYDVSGYSVGDCTDGFYTSGPSGSFAS